MAYEIYYIDLVILDLSVERVRERLKKIGENKTKRVLKYVERHMRRIKQLEPCVPKRQKKWSKWTKQFYKGCLKKLNYLIKKVSLSRSNF